MSQRKPSADRAQAASFGRRLRAARREISQAELAEKAGLSRSAIANYELGRSFPANDVVTKIADALCIDESTLVAEPEVEDWELELKSQFPTEGMSDDEMALVRLLRCAPDELVLNTVNQLVAYIETEQDALRFMEPQQSAKDLARLYTIQKKGRDSWQVGAPASVVTKIARFLVGDEQR